MKYIVRLQSVELTNFKNVEYGIISLSQGDSEKESLRKFKIENLQSNIIGIYGQNGSGKTAIVDSLYFLKKLLTGKLLDNDTSNYIQKGKEFFTCSFVFYILDSENSTRKFSIQYSITVKKTNDDFCINSETLKYQFFNENEKYFFGKFVDYNIDNVDFSEKFMTAENLRILKQRSKDSYKKLQAYLLVNQMSKLSFIFNSQNLSMLCSTFSDFLIIDGINALCRYASVYLFIFRNEFSAKIMEGQEFHLSYSKELEEQRLLGEFIYKYSAGPIKLLLKDISVWKKIIDNLNIVLKTIIPNMTLEMKKLESSLDFTADSKEFEKFSLFSNRNGILIPLKYESDGIKKIISILGIIIDMYNNPTVTLVVDELDSGIFEYLLGEIVKSLEDSGMGQLIFTSHNLRPLELLKYKSLFFTTVNNKNRYTQLSAIKTTNNVRNVYYTAIQLGNSNDELYEMVDTYKIKDALFEAGQNAEVLNG